MLRNPRLPMSKMGHIQTVSRTLAGIGVQSTMVNTALSEVGFLPYSAPGSRFGSPCVLHNNGNVIRITVRPLTL